MNKEKFTLRAECVCYLLNHRAEDFWGDAVEALAVGHNTYATHLYGGRREQYALFLGCEETLWAGFFAEEHYRVERPPLAVGS